MMYFSDNLFQTERAPAIKLSHITATCLLCLAWILPGLIGHEPWKPDEAHSFGLVFHILNHGDWVVPTLAGEPYMEKPPFFYLSAAFFGRLFSPFLPLHDAVRLASGFYMAATLVCIGLAARALYGRGQGTMSALLLLGCLGLLVRAHQLVSDIGLLAGFALCLYGLALNRERPLRAGLITGTGVGLGFMCRGTLAPMVMALTCLLLPLLFREWRDRRYALTIFITAIASAPWLIIWPYALYQRSPELYHQWLWVQDLGRLIGLAPTGKEASAWYFLKTLPWFAWPALPLALWALWHRRRKIFNHAEIQLPLVLLVVLYAALSLDTDTHDLDALPLLLPIVLLATPALGTLQRSAANALDWFGIMTFGLLTLGLWLGWLALMTGSPAGIAIRLNEYLPGYNLPFNLFHFLIAVAFTLGWLALISRIGRSNRRAVINWAGGITMVWMLAMTLWLPWLDVSKNYRWMMASLQQSLPAKFLCISSRGLGEPQRSMLEYYTGILTQRMELSGTADCDLLLIQSRSQETPSVSPGWEKIWEGSRPGDHNERYRLYQRQERINLP
ncbi:MAG TPA: glycosyltransferase family 39 protein [Burkholderiales bacterium]|nr:glycosyltransferase family 39 protein [Burkholderiales bacterium]